MDQTEKLKRKITRRWFIEQCGVGMGALALNHLLAGAGYAAAQETGNPLAPKKPHFAPKAKNVIFLFMAGAPSHLEMFDYKPQLAKFDGTLPPPELLKGYRAALSIRIRICWGRNSNSLNTARAAQSCRSLFRIRRALSTTSRSSGPW